MVSNAPFTIKGSHKVFVAGPLVKKTGGKDSFRSWLQSEAAKVGEVVEILVDELPAVYLLPLVKSKGFIPVAATVKFSAPGTASKFIAGHHGKLYDKTTALDVQRIDERLSITDIRIIPELDCS